MTISYDDDFLLVPGERRGDWVSKQIKTEFNSQMCVRGRRCCVAIFDVANKTVKPNSKEGRSGFHSLDLHPGQRDKSRDSSRNVPLCGAPDHLEWGPAWARTDRQQGLDSIVGCYLLGLDWIVTIIVNCDPERRELTTVLTWRVLTGGDDKHFFVSFSAGRVAAGW